MKTSKVVIPPVVVAEIEEIGDYIAKHDRAAARRQVQRLMDRCLSLARFPNRGRVYKGEHRVLVEGSYLIFYRVIEEDDDLISVIVAVVHGARDVDALLDFEN